MLDNKKVALAEWRTGWRYVICNDFGQMCLNINTYTTGLMIKPLGEAFGWSRSEVSAAMVIFAIMTFFCAPFAGMLIDRHGARRVCLIGAPLTGLSLVGMGLSGPSVWSWFLAWAAFGIFSLFLGSQVWAAAISRHFDVSRGLALAVGFSGNGLGALFWPPFTVALIEHYNWRAAYFGMAAVVGIGLTVFVYVLLRGPAAMPSAPKAGNAKLHEAEGLTLRQALATSLFWRISVALGLMGSCVAAMIIHLSPLMTDKGMTAVQAAGVMTILAPTVIAGRITGGWLLDRFHGRYVMAAMFLAPAAACVTLVGYDGAYERALLAAALIGLTAGVEGDLLSYLAGRYFGVRKLGTIYGAMIGVFTVGYGCAPFVAGTVFDRLGGYDPALIGMTAILLLCIPFALTLGRYPYGVEAK